jgi:phosphoribosyl 1,2-cyclic phosphodiesterase
VRGSTPCHGEDTRRYGGNTSCVSVDAPGEVPLVFDLGTGLRYFGHGMPHDGSFHGVCLLTHLHWDHTQGLPFFVPTLRDGARFDIYAPEQEDGRSVAEVFSTMIRPPVFPVELEALPGAFTFRDVSDDAFRIGGYEVLSRLVPHVGNTVGYRLTWQGRTVVYISDHQQPYDGSMAMSDGVRELCDGADLLIHDAQYTAEEFVQKNTWGHCTVEYALWVAAECRVKNLVLFHHDPAHHDDVLDEMGTCALAAGRALGLDVVSAREGMVVDL